MNKVLFVTFTTLFSFFLSGCSGNDLEEMYVPSEYNIIKVQELQEG